MLAYRDRIVLQSNSPVSFAGGCSTESWATVTTFWGNVYNSNVSENYEHVKGQQKTEVTIIARYTTSIDKATCRLIVNNNVVHIEGVEDKTYRKRQIVITGRYENR